MNASSFPALAAGHLSLGYRRRGSAAVSEVLHDFSLSLGAREVVAVLGPSGVGKSTLVRVLAGLQQADAGYVQVLGKDVSAPHPEVGVVFQDPCLLPWRTVRDNVAFGLDFTSRGQRDSVAERGSRVAAVLEEVGLRDAAGLYPAELSGGMAQRVSLARCLARRPGILLLDEPFAALDAVTRTSMQVLLRRAVHTHAAAALLVTHDIDEALRIADRVLLLCGRPATLTRTWTLAPPADAAALRPVAATVREDIIATLAEASVVPAGVRPPRVVPAADRRVAA